MNFLSLAPCRIAAGGIFVFRPPKGSSAKRRPPWCLSFLPVGASRHGPPISVSDFERKKSDPDRRTYLGGHGSLFSFVPVFLGSRKNREVLMAWSPAGKIILRSALPAQPRPRRALRRGGDGGDGCDGALPLPAPESLIWQGRLPFSLHLRHTPASWRARCR